MEIRKAAVIGYPVKHSSSPVLHGYWINKYKKELEEKGIKAEYGRLEVKPEDLEKTLLGLKDKGYVGCNLTVPHKEAAFNILKNNNNFTLTSYIVGAVNTLYFDKKNELKADNSDVYGFVTNLKVTANFDFARGKAVVLGAGGAARAVVFGLIELRVPEIILINRTNKKALKVKNEIENLDMLHVENILDNWSLDFEITTANWEDRNEILADANLLVNTTSLGMKGKPELDINLEKLPKNALVTDIVYSPIEVDINNPTYTKLLKNASKRGNLVVEGLGMLLYQAVAGFEMWFGIKPEVTEDLRKHVLSHLK